MTDERYKEINNMGEDALAGISEEEYREYAAMRYRRASNQKDALEKLRAHIETAQQGFLEVWPTGFDGIDKLLDGGFLGGTLTFLGAVSSLGKSTFAMQIADQIAARGKHVLVFSLEMSKEELNAKSISRNAYYYWREKESSNPRKKGNLFTTSDILRGRVGGLGSEKRKYFDEALDRVMGISEYLHILRDNDIDIDTVEESVQAHKDAFGIAPFVILDYLQIMKPRESARTTDKRLLTDDDVNRLKDLAVRKEIPVFVISSFNRASYLDPVSMSSFKESGGIEYSSDILIGLQYCGMEYRKHWITKKDGSKKKGYESKIEHDDNVRQLIEEMEMKGANGDFLPVEAVFLKNRGLYKGKVKFDFCPKYNVFRESDSQDFAMYEWDSAADVDERENGDLPKKKNSLGKI